MARKRKSSSAEDLIDLVALLPWWVGVMLSAVAYVWLHGIASQPQVSAQGPGVAGQMAVSAIWHGLASIGQYVLPLLCLIGALVSALRRQRRNTLFENASGSAGAAATQGMSWQEFELLVGEAFRRRGYGVRETGGGGADGGVDLILIRGTEKFLVQCKHWKAFKVGVTTVRELYGIMAADGAAGGFVVTSGRFTAEATRFAEGRNIKLLDGSALTQLLREARTAGQAAVAVPARKDTSSAPARLDPTGPLESEPSAMSTQTNEIVCPRCAKPMVLRVARRGASAGQSFWGCTAFTEGCRGVRPL